MTGALRRCAVARSGVDAAPGRLDAIEIEERWRSGGELAVIVG
jgi:hypothetical protein